METNLRSKKRITLASPKLALQRVAHLRAVFQNPLRPVHLRNWADSRTPVPVENHCGTPACFGGHAVLEFAPVGCLVNYYSCTLPNGRDTDIAPAAANLLGVSLNVVDSFHLFSAFVGDAYKGLNERQEALRRLDIVEAYLLGKLHATKKQ